MSRYIKVEELLKAMDTWDKFGYTHTGAFVRNPKTEDYVPYVHYEDMVKCVSNFPTADVKPVVRGEWKDVNENQNVKRFDHYECSICHMRYAGDYNYCPYCGAEMRGGDNGNSEDGADI